MRASVRRGFKTGSARQPTRTEPRRTDPRPRSKRSSTGGLAGLESGRETGRREFDRWWDEAQVRAQKKGATMSKDTQGTRQLAGVSVPDGPLIAAAIEYSQRLSEPYLFHHAMRS